MFSAQKRHKSQNSKNGLRKELEIPRIKICTSFKTSNGSSRLRIRASDEKVHSFTKNAR